MINEYELRRVCLRKTEVITDCKEYFNMFPQNEGIFAELLSQLAWSHKFIGWYRNHISLSAVPLARKIYKQLGIVTFPHIERVACRGFDTSGGTWAWAMDQVHNNRQLGSIGSGDPVKYLLRKNIKLYAAEGHNSNGEIGGQ